MAAATPVGFGLGGDLVDAARSEGVSGMTTFESQRSSCRRVYEYPATRSPTFEKAYGYAKILLGYPEVKLSAGGFKYISRNIPHYINRFQVATVIDPLKRYFLYATKCELQGKAPTTAGLPSDGNYFPEYQHYTFQANYETLPYDILSDNNTAQVVIPGDTWITPDESYWQRYVSKVMRPSSEFITIPTGRYRYVGPGHIVSSGTSKLLSTCILQVTWHQIPERGVPSQFVNPDLSSRSHIEKAIGKVNSVAINGYSVGTLLLLGASMTPYRSPFGDRIYDITYMFKYFQPAATSGHNYILRTTAADGSVVAGAWTEVTTSATTNVVTQTDGVSIYDWYDFRLLFRAPN